MEVHAVPKRKTHSRIFTDFSPKRTRNSEGSSDNVMYRNLITQIKGFGPTRLSQFSEHEIAAYAEKMCMGEMPGIVASLEAYLTDCTNGVDQIYERLKTLFEQVSNLERRAVDENTMYVREDKNAENFYNLGGMESAIRIIMLESLLPPEAKCRQESPSMLRMKAVLFEVLGRIITTEIVGEQVAKDLSADDEFMVHMFHYLQFDQTFLSACSLLEDILQNRPVIILSTIPNIKELIVGFDKEKLMNFCRILAVTVSDLDVYDNKTSLYAQNKQKRQTGFVNIRDLNQEYLLQIPELIKSLVSIACTKDYSPRYRGLNGEVENWMQWIDDSNSDELLDLPDEDSDVHEFIGAITHPSEPSAPWMRQPSLECIKDLVLKVEVVYVLGLLLLGKHRRRAQKMFSELNLIPGLSNLFDNFIWKVQGNRTVSRNRLAGHNASCECSPEVALKIQFMRLVHGFCDHSEFKHLLLTKSELNEIKKINDKAGILAIEGLDKVNRANMCKGKEGLITKIVEVMKKEPTSSTFRFWLARSVESYLRGMTSFCDQIFLLRRGILQHVVNNMLDSDDRPKEILQSGFDLLGELIKFNIEAFKIIEDILRTTEMRRKFIDLVNKNLVDSNMFIRSSVLSYGFFINELVEHADYASRVNCILTYVGDFQHQVNYLHELINITTVMSVSQENVSCLNTTLVLLMLATKSKSLPKYLEALRAEKVTYTRERRGGSIVMSNFRDLLLFWKDHYLSKDKDCTALEKSSRIKFSEWKQTVDTLLDTDETSPNSLNHYIDRLPGRAH